MKIAILSGSIPSSTFIEHLINGVSRSHKVLLFGIVNKNPRYKSRNIKIYPTPQNHLVNLLYTGFRTFLLLLLRPKDVFDLLIEVKKYSRIYDKWIWYSKFLPVVLYKPDIVHLQWARDLEFYFFLKKRFSFKLVVSLRGAHINYTPIVEPKVAKLYNNTFPKIDAFHAVSEAISLEAQKYGAPKDRINLIYSLIPKSFFDFYEPFRKSKSGKINIIMIGRFHWIKGYTYAIDAIGNLKNKGVDIHLTIVGPTEMTENINFKIHLFDLQERVSLVPQISQEKLKEKIRNNDILLLSSLNEGIANVVLEAMAIGTPVVSTNCGGMSEAVMDNKTGWLVPIRDSSAIQEAILDINSCSEIRLAEITKNAHDHVMKHFLAENNINKFMKLYEIVHNAKVN